MAVEFIIAYCCLVSRSCKKIIRTRLDDHVILSIFRNHRFIDNFISVLQQKTPHAGNLRLRGKDQFLCRTGNSLSILQNPAYQRSPHASDSYRINLPWSHLLQPIGQPEAYAVIQTGFTHMFPRGKKWTWAQICRYRGRAHPIRDQPYRKVGMVRSYIGHPAAWRDHICRSRKPL